MKPLSGRPRKSLQNGAVWRDKRGMSSVEFALLVPIILLMYVGTFEAGRMITIERRVETVASTAADLAAQSKTLKVSEIQAICSAAEAIFDENDKLYTGKPKIVLSSVVADQNNNGKVDWSLSPAECGGGTPLAKGSSYAPPAGTTEANSSVIVAQVTYAFTPSLNVKKFTSPTLVFDNPVVALTLQRTIYARPRRSLTVTLIP